jgi:uncharacterized membrane protein
MARRSHWENTKRIETLVDGIFAIAMTLLVLNLDVPQLVYPVPDATMQNILIGLGPKLFTYALSFILLAIFWRVNHSQFYHIKRANTTLLWITIIWLLFVGLVPFSTSLTGEYGYLTSAQVFFSLNLLFIGSLSALIWYYATERNLIGDELSFKEIMNIRRLNLVLPVVSLLALGMAFINPSWSGLSYALIPIILRIVENNHAE